MRPLAWSFSSLDDFKNCPRAFYEKRIAKSVQQTDSPEMIWGNRVHKAFENRQLSGEALPPELAEHESYMQHLENLAGDYFVCEEKFGFDLKGKPCAFFARDVWARGVIDYLKVDQAAERATIVDYKTGKPHDKWIQLALFALYTFAMFPEVQLVNAQFYWTKTAMPTKKVWGRAEVPALWHMFLPDLRQYMQAFKTDTWQERPSGLCNGWCPVTDCPHWRPKRTK